MSRLFSRLQRSLTTRLLLLFALMSLLIVALLIASLTHGFATQWRFTIRPHLDQYLEYMNAEIGYPPSQQRARELAQALPINIYIHGPKMRFSTTDSALDLQHVEFSHRRRKHGRRLHPQFDVDPARRRPARLDIGEHDDRTILRSRVGQYSVFYELSHHRRAGHNRPWVIYPLLALLLILAICAWLLQRMLRPVHDIKTGAEKMGAGQLDYRVPVRANNDLGALASSVNNMAAKIQQMLDAKRQLLLGASHELRSPLTRAKVALAMLEPSSKRDGVQDDLDEMETLIAGIMESERIKGGHAILQPVPVDILSLVNAVLGDMQLQDQLLVKAEQPLKIARLDETRVRLLLRNVIGNAVSHGANETQLPQVHLATSATQMTITVTDYGAGIEPQHMDKITQPFYRADPSRTRNTGGYGMGLHLCELIAEVHGGSLSIDSKPGRGTTVQVVLPILPTP